VPIDIPARIAFLKKIHLFYGLQDDAFAALAEELDELPVAKGAVIFEQDSKPDGFYLIYGGTVRVVRRHDKKETQLALLVKNDYFGELALVANRRRSGTAIAVTDTILLVLKKPDFEKLYKRAPNIKANLEIAVQSRQLASKLQFKWLRSDEVIYFLARKNRLILYQSLALPLASLLLPLALLYIRLFVIPMLVVAFAAVVSFVGIVLWTIWRAVDWGNDYYIVTNQRVVYIEKVVGIYDSRHESPLHTIASVGLETSQVGKLFGHGDVIIRTYVGKIVFADVEHPAHAIKMIEEYWNRTKEHAASLEKEALKNAIRKRLGLPLVQERGFGEPTPIAKKEEAPPKRSAGVMAIMKFLGANTLKLRYEQGENVIYRKHWVVLIIESWMPVTGTLGTLLLFIIRLIQLAFLPDTVFVSLQGGFGMDTWALAFLIAALPFIGWLIYETMDWSNDKFEVTNDQIIDVDRKPFGTESRNAASLDGILSTSYERKGFLGNLLNFGTVYITVGGNKLAFEDVMDPATVQSDIDRRRMVRAAKKKESEIAAERDRMAEWLATYHRASQEFREEERRNQKKE
jgi:CRP-like cAMP-binding protein